MSSIAGLTFGRTLVLDGTRAPPKTPTVNYKDKENATLKLYNAAFQFPFSPPFNVADVSNVKYCYMIVTSGERENFKVS